jgi:tetratricopeptide (TPR) repeat protein
MSVVVQATAPGNVASGRVGFTVDGDSMKGAGSEPLLRYFGNMFGVTKHRGAYVGATLAEGSRTKARTSMYRFHVNDPIPFSSNLAVTVDRGPNNVRTDRMSAVAYWYQGGIATLSTKLAASRERRWESPTDEELALWKRSDEIDDEIIEAYRADDLDRARTLLEELLQLEPDNAIASYNLACLYALGGQADKALHLLQQAVDLGFSELSFARHDPDLASLHDHERFRKLVGLP